MRRDGRFWAVVVVLAVLSVAADVASGSSAPGLTTAIGFVGCVAIILFSKNVVGAVLQRDDPYYPEDGVAERDPAAEGGAGDGA